MPITAGVYARISLDRRDGEGVARQLADCGALCVTKGWAVEEYVDNDTTAYRRKARPQWDRMLADLRSGHLGAVVAYHPDRLYRRLTDLEDFTQAVTVAGAEVVTVKAGDIDLSSASGRMTAAILGAVSRHEAERIGERVSRAKLDRAREGKPAGGGVRPFGLTARRDAVVPEEATAIRQVAAAILGGATITSQAGALNAVGMRTPAGGMFTTAGIRRMLTSPYVAARRSYKGVVVGDATWPAILDVETWERLCTVMVRPARGRPPSDGHLLTGLIVCGVCGTKMYVNNTRGQYPYYRCNPSQTTVGKGGGCVTITKHLIDDFVTDRVGEWLADPEAVAQLDVFLAGGSEVADALAELELIEQEREQWAAMAVDKVINMREWVSARSAFDKRTEAAQAVVSAGGIRSTRITAREITDNWTDDMTVPERRPRNLSCMSECVQLFL